MKKTLLALLFLLGSKAVFAKDLGVQGVNYEIREQNLLSQIQDKLKDAEKTGKIAKMQEGFVKQSQARFNRPQPITSITNAKVSREWLYDPSVSLDHDLKDQLGQVFYKAGTKVNPLEKISLSNALIFIDGDDSKQVNWALTEYKVRNKRAKIILVKGAVLDLMRAKKVRIYFDQNGILTSKFDIKHVPALLEQAGKVLKVREVAI